MKNKTREIKTLRCQIGRNIHRLRQKRHMRLGKLSRLTGVSVERLDAFELGKYDIGLVHLLGIARALNCHPAAFLKEA